MEGGGGAEWTSLLGLLLRFGLEEVDVQDAKEEDDVHQDDDGQRYAHQTQTNQQNGRQILLDCHGLGLLNDGQQVAINLSPRTKPLEARFVD